MKSANRLPMPATIIHGEHVRDHMLRYSSDVLLGSSGDSPDYPPDRPFWARVPFDRSWSSDGPEENDVDVDISVNKSINEISTNGSS